jgi:hypothetical protein
MCTRLTRKQENTRLNHSDGSRRKTVFPFLGIWFLSVWDIPSLSDLYSNGFANIPYKWFALNFIGMENLNTRNGFFKEFSICSVLYAILQMLQFFQALYSILSLAPINTLFQLQLITAIERECIVHSTLQYCTVVITVITESQPRVIIPQTLTAANHAVHR